MDTVPLDAYMLCVHLFFVVSADIMPLEVTYFRPNLARFNSDHFYTHIANHLHLHKIQ